MTLILRSVKNAELEWQEVDGNFVYLENKIDELEQQVGGDEVVKVTAQTFLPAQEDQVRANIKAASAQELTFLEDRFNDLEIMGVVTYSMQSPTPQQQQQLRENADVYSRSEINGVVQDEVSLALAALPPKPKAVFSHTLTTADVAQATITLSLQHVPDVNDFYDLHINGVYVNDDDYMVQQNKIIIAKSNIAYEVQAGMKLTFRYRY